MELRLSPERERFVLRCVAGGRFENANQVLDAALRLLETQGGTRDPMPPQIAVGLEQVVAGRSSYFTLDDVKRLAVRRGGVS